MINDRKKPFFGSSLSMFTLLSYESPVPPFLSILKNAFFYCCFTALLLYRIQMFMLLSAKFATKDFLIPISLQSNVVDI